MIKTILLTSSFNLLLTHIHLNCRLFSSSFILMLNCKVEIVRHSIGGSVKVEIVGWSVIVSVAQLR